MGNNQSNNHNEMTQRATQIVQQQTIERDEFGKGKIQLPCSQSTQSMRNVLLGPNPKSHSSQNWSCMSADNTDQHELNITECFEHPKGRLSKKSLQYLSKDEIGFLKACAGRNISLIRFYQQNKNINVNLKDEERTSALHVAVRLGTYFMCEELIRCGANVNMTDLEGWTPLHLAVHFRKYEVCALLLQHGADCTIQNYQGQSPIDLLSNSEQDYQELFAKHLIGIQAQKQSSTIQLQQINGTHDLQDKLLFYNRNINSQNLSQVDSPINNDNINNHNNKNYQYYTSNNNSNYNSTGNQGQILNPSNSNNNSNSKTINNITNEKKISTPKNQSLTQHPMKYFGRQVEHPSLNKDQTQTDNDVLSSNIQTTQHNYENTDEHELQYDEYSESSSSNSPAIKNKPRNFTTFSSRSDLLQQQMQTPKSSEIKKQKQKYDMYFNSLKKQNLMLLQGDTSVVYDGMTLSVSNEEMPQLSHSPFNIQRHNCKNSDQNIQYANSQFDVQLNQNQNQNQNQNHIPTTMEGLFNNSQYNQNSPNSDEQVSSYTHNSSHSIMFSDSNALPLCDLVSTGNTDPNVRLAKYLASINHQTLNTTAYQQQDQLLSLSYVQNDKWQNIITHFQIYCENMSEVVMLGVNIFSENAVKGLSFLLFFGLLKPTPKDIGDFLFNQKVKGGTLVQLSKACIGQVLTNLKIQEAFDILKCYLANFDFHDMTFQFALQYFLQQIELDNEPENIDMVLSAFAHRIYKQIGTKFTDSKDQALTIQNNKKSRNVSNNQMQYFSGVDAVHMLSFAMVMLDLELRHPSRQLHTNKNLAVQEFVSNIKGLNNGKDFDNNFQQEIIGWVTKYSTININSSIMSKIQKSEVQKCFKNSKIDNEAMECLKDRIRSKYKFQNIVKVQILSKFLSDDTSQNDNHAILQTYLLCRIQKLLIFFKADACQNYGQEQQIKNSQLIPDFFVFLKNFDKITIQSGQILKVEARKEENKNFVLLMYVRDTINFSFIQELKFKALEDLSLTQSIIQF